MKNIFTYLIAIFITGCATQTLTLEETSKYSNMSLEEFVKNRFPEGQRSNKINATYYTAYFNSANNRQLFRPTAEITNYCKTQGGAFARITPYVDNPFSRFFRNPSLEAFETYSYATSQGLHNRIASNAAKYAREDAELTNAFFDKEGAEGGFAPTRTQETFGAFECRSNNGNVKLWAVSIVPIGYKPRDPNNHLISHSLVIEMKRF